MKQRLGREQTGYKKNVLLLSLLQTDRKLPRKRPHFLPRGCMLKYPVDRDSGGVWIWLGPWEMLLLIINFHLCFVHTAAREAGFADIPKGLLKVMRRHGGVGHSWNPFSFVLSGLTTCQLGSPVPMARPRVGWAL